MSALTLALFKTRPFLRILRGIRAALCVLAMVSCLLNLISQAVAMPGIQSASTMWTEASQPAWTQAAPLDAESTDENRRSEDNTTAEYDADSRPDSEADTPLYLSRRGLLRAPPFSGDTWRHLSCPHPLGLTHSLERPPRIA